MICTAAPGPEEEAEPVESGESTLDMGSDVSVDPDKVRRTIARWIVALAARHGWTGRVANRVQLVLDEVASNISSHGRTQGSAPHMEICIACEGDTVQIDVTDDGVAFNPLTEAPPVPMHDRNWPVAIGGLGLHFVRAMTRTMTYRYEGGRNHLRLTIGIGTE